MKNFTLFWWAVRKGKYSIEDIEMNDGEAGRYVIYRLPPDGPVSRRLYQPLRPRKNTALCIEFGKLETNQEEKILSFVEAYGFLTRKENRVQGFVKDASSQTDPCPADMESFALWQGEIIAMKRAYALWMILDNSISKRLAQIIEWKDKGSVYCYPQRIVTTSHPLEPEGLELPLKIDPPHALPRPEPFQPGDIEKPAWVYLQRLINDHLRGRVSPQFVELRQTKNPNAPSGWGWRLVPDDLLGALWLQFGQMIEEGWDYRTCAYCGKPFWTNNGEKRRDSKYCSASCRNLSWRGRERKKAASNRAKTKRAKRAA